MNNVSLFTEIRIWENIEDPDGNFTGCAESLSLNIVKILLLLPS
jgi:hypothetical protein